MHSAKKMKLDKIPQDVLLFKFFHKIPRDVRQYIIKPLVLEQMNIEHAQKMIDLKKALFRKVHAELLSVTDEIAQDLDRPHVRDWANVTYRSDRIPLYKYEIRSKYRQGFTYKMELLCFLNWDISLTSIWS